MSEGTNKAAGIVDVSREVFIGVDPDLHATAIAILDGRGYVRDIHLTKVHDSIKGQDAVIATVEQVRDIVGLLREPDPIDSAKTWVVVESQEVSYSAKQGANPRSMIPVAQVAGIAMGLLATLDRTSVSLALPQKWKGSVPKHIHQARIAKMMGWEYRIAGGKQPYVVPKPPRSFPGMGKCTDSTWKHAMDAVGLALYAREIRAWGKWDGQ